MNLRRRYNRARDLAFSVATVVVAPVIGAVGGAILFTGAMSVIAYYVFTTPEDGRDIGSGGD